MKKHIILPMLIILVFSLFTMNTFALTEQEVQDQINAHGQEAVTGNIFIWFLCAIAFLKVSQKIDSFMSSLGINVGHTGGSMLAEAMIAARGFSMVRGGGHGGGYRGSHNAGSSTGFLSGGLAGAVTRGFTKNTIQSATNNGGNLISKTAFQSSLAKGGSFANNIISSVAKGNISNAGTITGGTASQSLTAYMGNIGKEEAPKYDNVEIGGGRITGMETSVAHPEGKEFAMYSAEQYVHPDRTYDTVKAADGSQWYRQYATDQVNKTPYMDPNGKIKYNEEIVQKLPDVPRRKDRI